MRGCWSGWIGEATRLLLISASVLALGCDRGAERDANAPGALFGLARPGAPPASLLFILVDTLRADRLGSYGYPRATSPFLDEIARGELAGFRLQGSDPMRHDIYLLMPSDRELRPSERAFVETLGDCCAVSISGCVVEGADGSGS